MAEFNTVIIINKEIYIVFLRQNFYIFSFYLGWQWAKVLLQQSENIEKSPLILVF